MTDISNPPGLSELAYRAARHGSTLAALQLATGSDRYPGLVPLTTTDPSDWTLAYLDAVASLAHVVSFHSERIANESYLATAIERFSIRHLARLVDHELTPGKAADVQVQFDFDDRPDVPLEVPLPAGIAIDSVPGPGEDLQHYETVDAFVARRRWSAMRPLRSRPVDPAVAATATATAFVGAGLRAAPGDLLVFTTANDPDRHMLRVVTDTRSDTATGRTTLGHANLDPVPQPLILTISHTAMILARLSGIVRETVSVPPTVDTQWVGATLDTTDFRLADLARPIHTARVGEQLVDHLASRRTTAQPSAALFRARAGLFGVKGTHAGSDPTVGSVITTVSGNRLWLPLDNVHEGVGPGSLIAVLNSARAPMVFTVEAVDQVTASTTDTSTTPPTGYSATVTRLLVDAGTDRSALEALKVRATSVALRTDPLAIAEAPIDEDITGTVIDLDILDLDLVEGQSVAVTGERTDLPGVVHTVIRGIGDLHVLDGRTVITLDAALDHPLRRDTVVVNANVVAATHGRTVQRVLGGGDGTAAFQTFVLPDSPLTHVRAPTPTGVEPTLSIRIDGVEWHHVRRLVDAGADDRVYELRNQEDGTTLVRFGDGQTGARLPSGSENIIATYRVGLGRGGLVAAGQLTLLKTKPLGIRGVTNPVAASDAADGDTVDDARVAAPAGVMTLDRVVSLRDHEDFARAYLGIGKASAAWVWDGRRRAVVVTVASADGTAFDPGAPKLTQLAEALRAAGDGSTPVAVVGHRSVPFVVAGSIAVDPDHDPATVVAATEAALRDRYRFERSRLGGIVARSEVIALVQSVPGVVLVDLDILDRADAAVPGNQAILRAEAPVAGTRTDSAGVAGAELLVIDDRPLSIGVMP